MKLLAYLIGLLAVIALVTLALFWCAFTVHTLWSWFVEPAWGIASPGLSLIAGMILMIRLTVPKANQKPGDFDYKHSVVTAFAFPLVCLAFGWIIKQGV